MLLLITNYWFSYIIFFCTQHLKLFHWLVILSYSYIYSKIGIMYIVHIYVYYYTWLFIVFIINSTYCATNNFHLRVYKYLYVRKFAWEFICKRTINASLYYNVWYIVDERFIVICTYTVVRTKNVVNAILEHRIYIYTYRVT